MYKEAVIYMDAETYGRFFCTGMCRTEPFHSLEQLIDLLRASASGEDGAATDLRSFAYPQKGQLATIRLSIVAVDSVGLHGFLRLPQAERIAFKSSDALLTLIQQETQAVISKRQSKRNTL